jgi:hypothetical protein
MLATAQTPSTSPLMELMMLEAMAMLLVSGDHRWNHDCRHCLVLPFRYSLEHPCKSFEALN